MRIDIFRTFCDMTMGWHEAAQIVTCREFANRLGVSKYKAMKYLHELRNAGLIERGCVGGGYEEPDQYGEVWSDEPIPPRNGWMLTNDGYRTQTYLEADKAYMKSLADWANGTQEDNL